MLRILVRAASFAVKDNEMARWEIYPATLAA